MYANHVLQLSSRIIKIQIKIMKIQISFGILGDALICFLVQSLIGNDTNLMFEKKKRAE